MPFGTAPILAPVDVGANPEAALDWVTAVARLTGRSVEIYFAAPHRTDEPLLREELVTLARHAKKRLSDRPEIKITHTFEPKWDPSTAIIQKAKAGGHSLIVQVTHERSAFKRLIHGSTTDEVISNSPCPVLAVPDDLPAPTGQPFKRILVATDLGAIEPMALAAQWAAAGRSALTYLSVVDSAHAHLPELAMATDPEAQFEEVVEGARRSLNAFIHEHPELKPSIPYDVRVRIGDSAKEITRDVDEGGYDLVIAGHHQRGLLSRLLLGSVAEEVLHKADVPVLIVPEVKEES